VVSGQWPTPAQGVGETPMPTTIAKTSDSAPFSVPEDQLGLSENRGSQAESCDLCETREASEDFIVVGDKLFDVSVCAWCDPHSKGEDKSALVRHLVETRDYGSEVVDELELSVTEILHALGPAEAVATIERRSHPELNNSEKN
jgi:hypothetical protein